jgi:exopolyphosphatase/guanosine-5'-triphosphate,3'-diphosphate pyrophosphatase
MRSVDHPLTDPHAFTLGAGDAARFAHQLARARPADLAQAPGISRMRSEKLPDAAALLQVLLAGLKPQALIFSSWGLREGLYFETLSPRQQAEDPLLAGVTAFAMPADPGDADAGLLAEWTAPAARKGSDRTVSLRIAAAHLAMALHRVEPNLRSSHALEWALDKRWIGVDFGGRAMLSAALRGSLGIVETHPSLGRLASPGELREATAWGLAVRLAQRLGAGARQPLAASRLVRQSGCIELQLGPAHAALATAPVEKDLAALAGWLRVSPRLTIG